MPFLKSFKSDVFVSYSHVDNFEDIDGQQCVSLIVRQMRSILQQRLSKNDIEIFWDASHLRANQILDSALQEQVAASAVMVAIVSPSYFEPGSYTIEELEWFLKQPGAEDRLFVLEILPTETPEDMHSAVRSRIRFHFWRNAGTQNATPMTLDPKTDRQVYMTELTDFCNQVRDRLINLSRAYNGGAAQIVSGPAEPIATVVLGQTTDDLEYERGQVRSALQQFNVRVLPEMDYPQGGNDFREAFAADLAQADLVVQLLGRAAGRMPADMPDGYLIYQCDAAEEMGKPIACWRHPEIDLEGIDNPLHRSLLGRPSVMACGLEAFKSQILKRIEDQKKAARPVRSSLIFIGADRSDMPLAEELLKALSAKGLPVAVPIYEGTPQEIQQDLEENLIDSDSVLFVHGAAPTTWVRGFLRRLGRSLALRDGPPDCTALVKAPPPKPEPLNHAFPNLQVIDCSEEFDVARIVAEMEASL